MRFHLIYSGQLPSSGNKSKPDDARKIRDALHCQMEELWKVHRVLHRLRQTAIVYREGDSRMFTNDSPFGVERDVDQYPAREDEVDLTTPIDIDGQEFVPLIRKSLDLNCSLSISFLRQEDPGELVLQGGDLDGRIKTLLDALTMPKPENAVRFPQSQKRTYCLMESDSLVYNFEVDTGRLLFPERTHPHEVHLLIEVSVNILRVGSWNMPLLGS